ncbi:MAG: response regulator [Desulfobacteraceae bacterium]|nr:response regulator [Desulfobacteraceae bacterium]
MKLKSVIFALTLLAVVIMVFGLSTYHYTVRKAAFAENMTASKAYLVSLKKNFSQLISKYNRITKSLAGHDQLTFVLKDTNAVNTENANKILELYNSSTESAVCYLLNKNGLTVASSNRGAKDSFVGHNYAFRTYFKQAIAGTPAVYMAYGVTSKKRGIYFSHPIYHNNIEGPIGVVVIKEDIDKLEQQLLINHYPTQKGYQDFFTITNEAGMIFMSDQKQMLLKTLWKINQEEKKDLAASKQFGQGPWDWSGLTKNGQDESTAPSGRKYKQLNIQIDEIPSWSIVHFSDITAIADKFNPSFIKTFNFSAMAICLLVLIILTVLNLLASSEIGKRRKFEIALKSANERYSLIFQNAPLGICHYSKKGIIVECNYFFSELVGMPRQKLLGLNLLEAMPKGEAKQALEDAFCSDDSTFEGPYRIIPGHKIIMIRSIYRRIIDKEQNMVGVVGIFENIFDTVKAKIALEQSEELFREIFNNMGTGVTIYEVMGQANAFHIKDINPAGAKISNINRKDYIGRSVKEVYPDVHKLKIFEVFKQVWQTGQAQRYLLTLKEGDRISLWIDHYISMLPSGDILAVYDDITDRKKAEIEKESLQHQLRQTQKMEAIGVLAGGIAHDFNNILFPLIGYAEMLHEDISKENSQHESVEEILSAALRARELVKQILTFSRQAEKDSKPLKMQLIIKEVLRLARASLPKTIEIVKDIDKKCHTVLADPSHIHQIVMNLITNAYHAMESKGGQLRIKLTNVTVNSNNKPSATIPSGSYICLTVSDNGIGMDDITIEKIFDPYFTTKSKEKGTGLGLSVVHGIVKSCKGEIVVKSKPGSGSIFEIYLPAFNSGPEPKEETITESYPTGTENILLIDDEEPIARLCKQTLERLGYLVEVRVSSVEGLKAFKARPNYFDIIITDMTMPNMTGDLLASEVLKVRADMPVILCTGFSEIISRERADQIGIKGFLMKPILKSELARMVRKILDKEEHKTLISSS